MVDVETFTMLVFCARYDDMKIAPHVEGTFEERTCPETFQCRCGEKFQCTRPLGHEGEMHVAQGASWDFPLCAWVTPWRVAERVPWWERHPRLMGSAVAFSMVSVLSLAVLFARAVPAW